MSGVISQIASILGYGVQSAAQVVAVIGSQIVTGWTEATIRVGVEIMPWTADLGITYRQPQGGLPLKVNEGDTAQIYIGTTPLITGYVVGVVDSKGPDSHEVRLQIASKSMDLVDCSAEFSTYQMNSTNALAVAQRVAAFAGINVIAVGDAGNTDIQQFSVILTETAYEVIERLARLAGVLFYDRPDGNVTMSRVGSTRMASGFVMGGNVEHCTRARSMAGRYSTITAVLQNTVMLFTSPNEADYVGQMEAISSPAKATDVTITRNRPLLIPVELGDANAAVAQQRVLWEAARRWGRSRPITVTCDSWVDSEGKIWCPNTLAPFTDEAGSSIDYVIGEITFRKGSEGTRADVVLMPPAAFQPEPILLPAQSNEAVQAINS
ncbi:phage baseplate assembly protein [Acetobacter estunensis]|uniref:phage baseplate assembly protein n=1 Tax=Acetobacter estunensis TaxID=104097 RepID=UPI001C2D9E51|nr:phage tail protein [Acetobacter estunensis]MBV1835661.1 phage tail protein [Acetobacter estunensis]MBV1836078.1 phage tail protein [Acetobacter estunensis]